MQDDFLISPSPFIELKHKKWIELGIEHGFTGKALYEKSNNTIEAATNLCEIQKIDCLILPQQNHTAEVLLIEKELPAIDKKLFRGKRQADAVLFITDQLSKSKKNNIAIAVATADCLPILAFGKNSIAAIHSGWRGLVNNIIKNTIELALKRGERLTDFLIGPSATIAKYEVQQDVIDKIGKSAVFKRNKENKIYLSLAETAARQIKNLLPNANISITDACTMSDSNFNSHRIDPNNKNRNLAFISTFF